ncbi:YcnI family protein [Pseudonocardia spinosispora]|uniref:YcnI family copper-binding membrane protein n=1 Tax=Pseudonocardia spinosispora TaxID=103441 RepID=UPI000400D579|nr:YcnI family protein [Pseudonocardia spinosispora]
MSTSRSTRRALVRAAATVAAAAALTLAGTGIASAHVTAQPGTAEQGSYAKVAFRVPSELPTAGTVKLQVTLPADHPIASVRTAPLPGWTAEVTKGPINPPIESHGTKITEAVRTITWTAQPGTRLGPTEFADFEVSLGALPDNTDKLVMPAQQTYDDGTVVNWDQVQADGADEPEHPAPTLKLVPPAGGAHGGHSHGDMSAAAHGSATSTSSDAGHDEASEGTDNTARWLGGIGLVLGALGLGLGIGSVARNRRSGATK